jgi:hypothetical protein
LFFSITKQSLSKIETTKLLTRTKEKNEYSERERRTGAVVGWTRDSAVTMAVAAALTVSMLLLLRLVMAGFGGKHGEEVYFPVTGV